MKEDTSISLNYFTERGYLVFLHEHLHHGSNITAKDELGIFQSDFPTLIKEQAAYTEKLKKDYPVCATLTVESFKNRR